MPLLSAPRRRAASAVEFAVVASIFFIFIMGLVELGRGFMVSHQLTNAARLGCRTAVIELKTTANVNTVVSSSLSANKITGATTTVKVNGVTADASTAQPGDVITVSVSVPTDNVTWVPGARYLVGGTMTGQYSLKRE